MPPTFRRKRSLLITLISIDHISKLHNKIYQNVNRAIHYQSRVYAHNMHRHLNTVHLNWKKLKGSILFDCPSIRKKSMKNSDRQSVYVSTTVYSTTRASLMTSLFNDMYAIFPSLLASFIRGSRIFRFFIILAEKSSLKKIPSVSSLVPAGERIPCLYILQTVQQQSLSSSPHQGWTWMYGPDFPAQFLSSTPFLLLNPML